MPVRKVPGGYKWGNTGKTYPTKSQAERQGRAVKANSGDKKPKRDSYRWDDKKKGKKDG